MKTLLITLLLILGQATTDSKPPEMTEVQKLQLQNKVQQMQIAAMQLERSREELATLVKTLTKPGYDIDLQTLTYVKKEDPPKKEK